MTACEICEAQVHHELILAGKTFPQGRGKAISLTLTKVGRVTPSLLFGISFKISVEKSNIISAVFT